MAFEFVARRPGPPLAPFVESVWFARGQMVHERERIAPTGSTVAVLVLGSPIVQVPRNGAGEPFVAEHGFLAGPHDGPVLNSPTAETLAVGVVSTPVGCRALFGVDPAPLRGRVVDLEAAWPLAGELRARLLRAQRRRNALTRPKPPCLPACDRTCRAGSDAPR